MEILKVAAADPISGAGEVKPNVARPLLTQYSELLLVATTLAVVVGVFHWTPHKIAFLNFFYLPVLAAIYLLGKRRAILISVMCVLSILVYYFWYWAGESVAAGRGLAGLLGIAGQNRETLLSLGIWGGFLILTGSAFAVVYERMMNSYSRAQEQAADLLELNQRLGSSTHALEQRSEQLQEKNLQIENLKQQLEEIIYSTMDPSVARLIIQGRLRQEKRNISVLFCDLKGVTSSPQLPGPEIVLEDLNNFYGAMEELIESYHGHIDKFMGDGIMCEFGAPIDHEQHCLEAVVAGMKMQEKFKEMSLQMKWPWQMRLGIASGESIVGVFGKRRRSYSALGEVVKLAKRLEELSPPGAVLIDEITAHTVRPWVEARPFRGPGGRRVEDKQMLEAIAEKEQQLHRDPQNPELLFFIGLLYFRMREATSAVSYFQRALELKPGDKEMKALYADASMKRDEYEKITIRGLGEKQSVFEAVRLVNPLLQLDRFPKAFYERYRYVEDLIEIPETIALPAEVVEASVGHSRSVAVLNFAIADQMGLPEDAKRDLLVAARLQDLGKSVVGHHVLNRRGGLSDEERKDLEGHVAESVATAKRMGFDRPGVLDIIGAHHELMDGTGYPRHLKGEEIPVGGRISCVADIYCALTSSRPYRNAWDMRAAMSELQKGASTGKYDAKVVNALHDLMETTGSISVGAR